MSRKFIPYPKTLQFRHVVENIISNYTYLKLNGKNPSAPIVQIKGTVKLHGTNAGVNYREDVGLWAQSRRRVITPSNDNFDFASYVETNQEALKKVVYRVAELNNVDLSEVTLTLFGEWAGEGIQKGVGVSSLKKSFYLFAAKATMTEGESKWLNIGNIDSTNDLIFNLNNFDTKTLTVDFREPDKVVDILTKLTMEVENECPVARDQDIPFGVGEGLVWTAEYMGSIHRFKVKGEKHSNFKAKTLKKVFADPEILSSIQEFVDYSVTEGRIQQGVVEVFGEESPEVKGTGKFLRWMYNDIIEEEFDVLKKNGLSPKDVSKAISSKARTEFFKLL